ncbi:hypothetical protein DOY81_013186 [Sarcophaga bullata]|nr:hypothetical protein DOY81_013186 [Sarcophaga bullata]
MSQLKSFYAQSYSGDLSRGCLIRTTIGCSLLTQRNTKQGVRIEECINEGSVCGENTGLTLPNHYKATCKQNYIYRSLVAYANETIVKDQFKMPSCCKCVLTVS